MNLIVFDVETTGLTYGDEILQLSIVDGNGKLLLDQLFKPTHKTSWFEAQEIHRISPELVKNCPNISDYKKQIQKIVDQAELLVGYNINFDITFLENIGIDFEGKKTIDIMKVFAPVYGEWSEYFGDYKWQKLTTCAAYFGYNYCPHLALEDVKATLYAYNKLKQLNKLDGYYETVNYTEDFWN